MPIQQLEHTNDLHPGFGFPDAAISRKGLTCRISFIIDSFGWYSHILRIWESGVVADIPMFFNVIVQKDLKRYREDGTGICS